MFPNQIYFQINNLFALSNSYSLLGLYTTQDILLIFSAVYILWVLDVK